MFKFIRLLMEISELLYQIELELQDLNFNLTHYQLEDKDND